MKTHATTTLKPAVAAYAYAYAYAYAGSTQLSLGVSHQSVP